MNETLELIRQRIALTEKYHEAKETLAWLGSTIYYGFCVASMAFLFSEVHALAPLQGSIFFILSVIIFTGMIRFINLQFRMRWDANRREGELNALLSRYTTRYSVRKFIQEYMEIEKRIGREKRCRAQIFFATMLWPILFWRNKPESGEYRTEIPAYAIATYLFLAQVAIIAWRILRR